MVGWQLQRLKISELADPVVVELLQPLTAQALALPGCVVLVVNGEGLELRGAFGVVGVVELGEITSE